MKNPIRLFISFLFSQEFESIKNGIHSSEFWQPALVADDISLGIAICYMLGSSILYLLVALYVDKMLPHMLEKCYIPLMKKCCFRKNEIQIDSNSTNPNIEVVRNRLAKISLNNLCKVYSNGQLAVDNLTMNIFSNQITILLGNNFAGKTTVMSMLTGIHTPTSGTILINGYNIQTNLQEARYLMSFCPQHNIVYEELSIREHIELFSRLKGLCEKNSKNEAIKYAKLFKMERQIDKRVKHLPGEIKRKLSIAITFCGRSKVIICDEPSLGMNTSDRHAIWNLMQREKRSRTILLTTHSMEETNIGDQIAIMTNGKLKCYGSPDFLKGRMSSGYRLVCIKGNYCVPNAVTEILRKFIPDIDVHEDNSNELVYLLPLKQMDKFEKLFQLLKDKQHKSGITSFSVFSTPMESVFGKIASNSMILVEDASEKSGNSSTSSSQIALNTPSISSREYPNGNTFSVLCGFRLYMNQLHAMFRKKFYCWLRNRNSYMMQIMILIIFIMITAIFTDPIHFHPKRKIDLSEYGKTVTLLELPTSFDDDTIKR